jgi:formate hydrogenlyase transcriptional activator
MAVSIGNESQARQYQEDAIAAVAVSRFEKTPFVFEQKQSHPSFLETIVGRRGGLSSVLAQLKVVAPTNATVLITGETGTGKEVIARAVHELSPRRTRNLVTLNCAAVPAGLFESELFGHERGAFTGAISQKVGRLELANQGTLFLDEVGDIPIEIQPKLLRALQEREFERLGSTRATRVDVRIVAATNGDLWQMVQDREFRDDLYYRLNVFPLVLPPLRERKRDIPEFVEYFVEHFASSMGKLIDTIPDGTMRAIVSHSWPGNVRELQNYLARGVILSKGGIFSLDPPQERQAPLSENSNPTLEDTIRKEILAACQRANWNIGGPRGAAARLGLRRTTLIYKMKRLGIRRPSDAALG